MSHLAFALESKGKEIKEEGDSRHTFKSKLPGSGLSFSWQVRQSLGQLLNTLESRLSSRTSLSRIFMVQQWGARG